MASNKPTYVSVARVWPAESVTNAVALREASKRLASINPAEAARIKLLAEVAR